MGFEPNNSILDIVEFNPTRRLKKGEIAPFVEMAAIPENDRNISSIEYREVKGGSRFKNGDTLFARITPCLENGKTAKVSGLKEGEIAHGSTEFIVMAAKEPEYDEDFVYYLSRLPEFRTFAQNLMQGTSGRQRVSWQSLTTYESCFPKKQIRKQVGQILKAFDDKIELNRQINQTLEEMAQAIFKSWFVDFEPVKAKIAVLENGGTDAEAELAAMQAISGKTAQQLDAMQTQHPEQYQQLHHTASLFPSAMQDSELGEIPAGWEIKLIGDCDFEIESGKRPKGGIDKSLMSGVPSVGAESIAPVGQFSFGNVKYITEEFASKAKKGWVKNYDVALYKDGGQPGLFKPRVALYGNGFPYDSFLVNEHVFLLRSQMLGQPFLYHLISSQDLLEQLIAKGSAKAAQPGLNQTEVKTSKFVYANPTILDAFNNMVKPMLDQQLLNGKKSLTLAELRDALLSKLLSGELQISIENAT